MATALLLAACGGAAPFNGRIVEYELTLTLSPGGSLDVTEQALVVPDGRPFRVPIAAAPADAVEGLEIRVDGQPVAREAGGVDPGARVPVPLPEGSDPVRVAVTYRAVGAMAVRGARGVIVWPAVPGGEGTAEVVRVRLTWPDGDVPMVGPGVEVGEWDVTVMATGALLTARDVPRANGPRVYVDLVLQDLSAPEPTWQTNALRARQFMPAFVSAGLFIAVVGAGILIMIRLRYPAVAPAGRGDAVRRAGELPDDVLAVLGRRRPWQASGAQLERLVAAGLVDADRLEAAHGLRVAAVAVGVAAVATAAVIPLIIGHLGPWPHAVPLGMLAAALMLGLRGRSLPVLTSAGVEAGVLHSRRLQASPEP